jgi:hypothetical protein
MIAPKNLAIVRTIPLLIAVCLITIPAQAKYGGGSGTAEDPYQIATSADLLLLGDSPEDYDKHFILTADIDLDPNLPGRKVFDKAVIAPTASWEGGTPFTGVLDGNGHTISHLTIKGGYYLGLFGYLSGEVRNMGLTDVNITGSGYCVGGLVGYNDGGSVTQCCSTGAVKGWYDVGGVVGSNDRGSSVTRCYSTGAVSGSGSVGGVVGDNGNIDMAGGSVSDCYSTGAVSCNGSVGGVVGSNWHGTVAECYSTDAVSGGGLVGLVGSGVRLTKDEMMDPYMLGLNGFANDPNWVLNAGRDYPRLAWEGTPGTIIPEPAIDWLEGGGTAEDPYRIDTAEQLIFLGRASLVCDRHFVLCTDINLAPNLPGRQLFSHAVIPGFRGTFDGSGHTISHLTITGESYVGLFGQMSGKVKDLGVVDVNIAGSGAGGLVGSNEGAVTRCYSTGKVTGGSVGGLVGVNYVGTITSSYSTCTVTGGYCVGGLVGDNEFARITTSYSTGAVSGNNYVGGLVGVSHFGAITASYSSGPVSGNEDVGGLAGWNFYGAVTQCYSSGAVSGRGDVGGLVGHTTSDPLARGAVTGSFWDIQTSRQTTSAGGTGKTTAEMQMAKTFLEAGLPAGPGWDFVNVWGIGENQTYPYLRKYSAVDINQDASVNFLDLAALAENWLTGMAP